jgi:hypothetical protein
MTDCQPLAVGTTLDGRVILRHYQLPVNVQGVGDVFLTPEQARTFARLLITQAEAIDERQSQIANGLGVAA